jgi:hypothetical protein
VKPPCSLCVELPISIGPTIGPDPWNNMSFFDVVISNRMCLLVVKGYRPSLL